jgi:succinoglycan biosynthesis protein ExoA
MSQKTENSEQTFRSQAPGVSVVLPILNEEPYLKDGIRAILAQEYSGPLEVILALGPSKDRTNEIARALATEDRRVLLVENPTGRTAAALNRAIAASQYAIICRIDGHAQISPTYIASAVGVMCQTNAVNVGGIMAASGVGAFERAVATAMRSPLGVGAARFHTWVCLARRRCSRLVGMTKDLPELKIGNLTFGCAKQEELSGSIQI